MELNVWRLPANTRVLPVSATAVKGLAVADLLWEMIFRAEETQIHNTASDRSDEEKAPQNGGFTGNDPR